MLRVILVAEEVCVLMMVKITIYNTWIMCWLNYKLYELLWISTCTCHLHVMYWYHACEWVTKHIDLTKFYKWGRLEQLIRSVSDLIVFVVVFWLLNVMLVDLVGRSAEIHLDDMFWSHFVWINCFNGVQSNYFN